MWNDHLLLLSFDVIFPITFANHKFCHLPLLPNLKWAFFEFENDTLPEEKFVVIVVIFISHRSKKNVKEECFDNTPGSDEGYHSFLISFFHESNSIINDRNWKYRIDRACIKCFLFYSNFSYSKIFSRYAITRRHGHNLLDMHQN